MPRKKPLPTVSTAKTRLQELQAMRRVLAAAIDAPDTPARELSPLVRRLEELGVAIEDLEARERDARKNRTSGVVIDMPFNASAI